MGKYKWVSNGKDVIMGKPVDIVVDGLQLTVNLDEKIIAYALKNKLIAYVPDPKPVSPSAAFDARVKKTIQENPLCNRDNSIAILAEFLVGEELSIDQLATFKADITDAYEGYQGGLKFLILRLIALKLDEDYTDHIKNVDTVYTIDLATNKIGYRSSASIKHWDSIAAFRDKVSAIIALKFLSNIQYSLGFK